MNNTIPRDIARRDVHVNPFELVVSLNGLIDILRSSNRTGHRRKKLLYTHSVLAMISNRSLRSIKKDMKTLIMMGAPIYRDPQVGWKLIDNSYHFTLTARQAKTLLSRIDNKYIGDQT